MPRPETDCRRERQTAQRLFEHALLLIARQHGGDPAEAEACRQAQQQWRQADPCHEAAFRAAQQAWQATEAGSLRGALALPPVRTGAQTLTRRRLISVLGLAGLGLATGGLGHWYRAQPLQQLSLRTGQGQIGSSLLADGSQLALAARTEARVLYYRDRREVLLAHGEIRFDVRPDPERPFIVVTDWGRVQVFGTVFSVAVRQTGMRVAVASGRVGVWRRSATREGTVALSPDIALTAGDSADIDHAGLRSGHVSPDDVGAWRQGWLVFDAQPLSVAVERWNDYLATPLVLERDAALAGLRLTGSFPLARPAAFLDALPRILPVRVVRSPDGPVRIQARR